MVNISGIWPLPGIVEATFVKRTQEIAGSIIQVSNTDGSTHQEQIITWDPPKRIDIRFQRFSPPLSYLADHFIERWVVQNGHAETPTLHRSFELVPKHSWTVPPLWLISLLLRRAIKQHTQEICG
ncbi:MAG: hypothetical protein ACQETE_00450 [Bacteroidota bacterium]